MSRRLAKAWWSMIDWVRFLFGRETRDEAWVAGSQDADEGWLEIMEDKDSFISVQSALIAALDEFIWNNGLGPALPADLENALRDYR